MKFFVRIVVVCVLLTLGYYIGRGFASASATPGQKFADSLAFAYKVAYDRGPHSTKLVAFFCNPYGHARFAGQAVFRCSGIERRKDGSYHAGTIFLTPDGGALTPDEARTALEGSKA